MALPKEPFAECLFLSTQSSLDDATDDWGIKVERVEIKDVKLPLQLQRAMAAEAEASREARAKVNSSYNYVIVFKGIAHQPDFRTSVRSWSH